MACGVILSGDGILGSTRPACLWETLYVLKVFLNRVGIINNFNKMVGVVFQPCCMASGNLEVVFERHMMRVRKYFRENQWEQLQLPECAADLASVLLVAHLQDQYEMGRSPQ